MIFQNRIDAGQKLAKALKEKLPESDLKKAIVLALPRGGVVVGGQLAQILKIPLDVIITRKIGAPGNPEFAIGAVGLKSNSIFNQEVIASYGISRDYLEKEIKKEKLEIMRRYDLYRRGKPPLNLRNKVAIVTDDGIATGATMQAAILEIKLQKPAKIILAVPVAPPESIDTLKAAVDEVVCLETSEPFFAIGNFYQNFQQTEDKEVIEILS
ncbi:MAG: phosphoribosyltransferase [Candidatus Nealsonbacteria bacterium CG23_combo_of_CG06-09_8_20_14_all_40_13]|uniref:Phosphoribosyltransferase n=1 Tax=Candidatus Nealsonbacteria bacterium CG23_combo_of_CG06-09_8_20_14_all_40_13 TaxID=1974724 RepID=A0A2G9YR89_9BACT|nr:MAG: phosphoribosyltransferase [Candidatus Nealsonbacteria bacterium CG23_combo_of_CG06-09_8_20_14_all_40_13]PIR71168.1 MAG: phosphoribosyltransferase [Candidatus Nealsonbacteria bacterium CG10_big_fil_rev_8_21_14_0_10_40_24]PIU43589.1 MAG: phosphoribosyltransferase [Candidatus Nealsonbacteria bacterium CG07_land_8_20_14_0_80_40_10]